MLKKGLLLVVTLLVVGFVITPLVQAQTAAQQQELEQIARRSMNGLSAQDRQRVITIMTDVYVAQGMPRQQAASLAEMAAGSMFSGDVGEMSPEQRRQFAEQDQRLQQFDQGQQQRETDASLAADFSAGRIGQDVYFARSSVPVGWPSAQAMARFGTRITRPQGNFTHTIDREEVTIYIMKTDYRNFTEAEARVIYSHFLAFGDSHPVYTGYRPSVESFISDGEASILYQDPQRPTTSSVRNMIQINISWNRLGVITVEIHPTQLMGEGGAGGR